MTDVVFPSLLLAALGVPRLILTNAAGGLNPEFEVGDLMLITEGLNFLFRPYPVNELPDECNLTRLDSSRIFSPAWRQRVLDMVRSEGAFIRTGVYIATTGPSYETPAEVGYLRHIGGDAIGMSTVPEATIAAALGIEVLGFSFITNLLADIPLKKTTHEEVIEASSIAGPRLAQLIINIISRIK
jgi:purine-nucleoside phosphorylase